MSYAPPEPIALLASLLVGGLAIFVATRIAYRNRSTGLRGRLRGLVGAKRSRSDELKRAIATAGLCAIAWALLAWIPLVGTVLALAGWILIVRLRYPGGVIRAAMTAVLAWVAAMVLLSVLELLGVGWLSALGIPGA